ncbi:AI-2E family transporter [Paludibacterium paludis]|uniref:AI-2E family transporter n=1 Tax=Paludibacterium paludis TaxID=1225769 RepID=A0A918P4B6_9NEIS|nr:AI-2E family transporter [Paludibacterium paludis]GGY20987.1 AI-2E family transporter [Paludibacterium paludis]
MGIRRWSGISVMAVIRVAVVLLLVAACLKIIQPFLGALIWSIIIAISAWPATTFLTERFGGRRKLAVGVIILTMLLALVAPITLMALSLADTLPQLTSMLHQLATSRLPAPPQWLAGIPLAGEPMVKFWISAQNDLPGLLEKVRPMLNQTVLWSLSNGARLGVSILEIVLAIIIAAAFLLNGEVAWLTAERTIVKLGGAPAEELPDVVARTIRSVMTGVVGTALVQTLLCVLGLVIAGVPGTLVLGFLCFMVAVAQLPTLVVWLPAAGWVFYTGETGYGIFLLAWGFLLVNTIDNFIKPILISHGANLPLALIFMGVIGGLIAWGVIGLFIGPTLLAVGYTLFQHWLAGRREEDRL